MASIMKTGVDMYSTLNVESASSWSDGVFSKCQSHTFLKKLSISTLFLLNSSHITHRFNSEAARPTIDSRSLRL